VSKSIIEQNLKQARIDSMPEKEKKGYKLRLLEEVFLQLSNKDNRYIFYCPDIAVVNTLVKFIYETAYEVQQLGYNIVVLHEIDGFKCKWLFNEYKHLKTLNVEYIIKKKSRKSNKTKSQYSFKISDTLIVPDQFQEILDNLIETKLIQKVILVSSYSGLSSLNPSYDYNTIGVKKLLFTNKELKEDYEKLFSFEGHMLDEYPLETFSIERKETEIYPTICLTNIGNNELAQQIINVFYNKYPNLKIFTFKVLPRDNYEYYIDSLKHCCLLLVVDKILCSSQMIDEAIQLGIPVASFKRRQVDNELNENISFGSDAFEIAESLAVFCEHWLNLPTQTITDSILKISTNLKFKEKSIDKFKEQIKNICLDLQEERIKYFASIKHSIDDIKVLEEGGKVIAFESKVNDKKEV